jgi:ABC-type Fe3+-hydroxamate transport system substrate-binding protein
LGGETGPASGRVPPIFAARGWAVPISAPSLSASSLRRAARLVICVLIGALACRQGTATTGTIRLIDDDGDSVVLARPARRIVSLVPATTELLFAIGAGSALVGRTTWCDYPPAAAVVPDLGNGIGPNVEAVLAQHPDLVLLYRSGQNAAAAEQFQRLGIPTARLTIDRLGDLDRVTTVLGQLTGHEKAADSVVAATHRGIDSATVSPGARRPTVLILVWDQPPMTVGAGSFLSELVERAGGKNLFGDLPSSSAQVSVEAVAARDPDLILTSVEGMPAFANRPEWQVVRAVRERRFIHISSFAFNRPSPRAGNAIVEITRKLHEVAK